MRGFVMEKPFLHIIGLRENLKAWVRLHGIPERAIQPEKHRKVAHVDVFGELAQQLIDRLRTAL
jgi:hypothetical protein